MAAEALILERYQKLIPLFDPGATASVLLRPWVASILVDLLHVILGVKLLFEPK